MKCDQCKYKRKIFSKSFNTEDRQRYEFEYELLVFSKIAGNEESFLVEFIGFIYGQDDVHPYSGTLFTKFYDTDLSNYATSDFMPKNKELLLDAALQVAQGFIELFFIQ